MTAGSFPGGTSVSILDIYGDSAPDGLCGGSPHMHLVSTEAYIVLEGRGALQSIDAQGFHETPLAPGMIVWFTPGTVHRAVNRTGLRIAVLMSNAGLPEAGDAVLSFPTEVLQDASAYRDASDLGDPHEHSGRAARRRDLAVRGFLALRHAVENGDLGVFESFHAAAGRIVRRRAENWSDLIRSRPGAEVSASLANVDAIRRGDVSHLAHAAMRVAEAEPEPGYGMCGRLWAYDVSGR